MAASAAVTAELSSAILVIDPATRHAVVDLASFKVERLIAAGPASDGLAVVPG